MSQRLAQWLFELTPGIVLLGMTALWLAETGVGEQQFWPAVVWYTSRQWEENPLLWIAGVVTVLALVGWSVTALRAREAFRRQLRSGAVPARQLGIVRSSELERRVRAALEPVLRRSPPRIDRVIDALLGALTDFGASELLLEPLEDVAQMVVRIGMDELTIRRIGKELHQQLARRLRLMVAVRESDIEGGGRIRLRTGELEELINVRFESAPHGTRIRLEAVRRSQSAMRLDKLRMPSAVLDSVRRALDAPYGLVLLAGPPAHGVSTTLYAAAHYVAKQRPQGKIISVEPEVHLEVPFMHQVETGAGMPAAVALPLLREEGAVLVVRNLRDADTAQLVIEKSVSGLVLVSVRARDPLEAVSRLVDLGVECEALAQQLRLSLAQRLLPRLCRRCRQPRAPAPDELEVMGQLKMAAKTVYSAPGCRACGGRGHAGSWPLYGLAKASPGLSSWVCAGAATSEAGAGIHGQVLDGHLAAAAELVLQGEIDARWLVRVAREATR